ncbi:hypothetical protein ACOAK2_12265 (plasmid) [Aliarcobacter butzleri]|uniref:hypothetical protein n=1 Tax=Aliarcobacter butzleri TaxID=28197 RepID=UPI003B28769B
MKKLKNTTKNYFKFLDIKRKIYFFILYGILEPISLIFFVTFFLNKFNLQITFLQLADYSDDVLKAYFIVALFFGGFKFFFTNSNFWEK